VIDKQVATVQDAIADLPDGATIMVGGFGGAGYPYYLVSALRERGSRDLTFVVNGCGTATRGIGVLIANRQVRRVVCSFPISRTARAGLDDLREQVDSGALELEVTPQGTLAERIRAGGAGVPAFFTPTGPGTLFEQGKETRDFNGQPCVLETALTADYAFVRAWQADRIGNLVYRQAQRNFNPLMASAARITVAEVYAVVPTGDLAPELVVTPGIYVDRVVVVDDDTPLRRIEGPLG
jgi:3-oxoadipate CoA-transferase alpha subunit